MSHDTSTVPLQHVDPKPLDSPARDSLQNNLDLKLSLKKKRSWFGNIRDAFHRGARGLVAPLTEISQKGEMHPSEVEEEDHRPSIESNGSRPSYRRAQTMPSRHALSSTIRRHIPGRKKRGSIYSLVSEGDGKAEDAAQQSSPVERQPASSGHRRHTSLVSSIKGSIRAVGRKTTNAPLDNASPSKVAAQVPLPSSPIDIPSLAPELSVDLGPPCLMPIDFGASFDIDTNPALLGKTGRPRNTTTFLPVETSTTPTDFLQLPTLDSLAPPPYEPTTPMPGTNLGFDFDGSPEDKVLERGVETPPSSDGKRLVGIRSMRSLDAIAEACRSNEQATIHVSTGSPVGAATDVAKIAVQGRASSTGHRDFASTSTAGTIPPDMEPISPQCADARLEQPHVQKHNTTGGLASSEAPSPLHITKLSASECSAPHASDQRKTSSEEPTNAESNVPSETNSILTNYDEFKTQHLFGHNSDEPAAAEYYDDNDIASPATRGLSDPPSSLASSMRAVISDDTHSLQVSDADGLAWQYEINDSDSSGSIFLARALLQSPGFADDSLDSISLTSEMAARPPFQAPSEQRPHDARDVIAQPSPAPSLPAVIADINHEPQSSAACVMRQRSGTEATVNTPESGQPRKSEDSMVVPLQDAVLDINKLQKHLDELYNSSKQGPNSSNQDANASGGSQENANPQTNPGEVDKDAKKVKGGDQDVTREDRLALGERSHNL